MSRKRARPSLPASPSAALPAAGCPILVAWGEHETSEFKRQSLDYLQEWRDLGFPGSGLEVAGANHFNILMQLRDPDSALARGTFELMGL